MCQTFKSLSKIKVNLKSKGGKKQPIMRDFFCPQGHTLPGGEYLLHNMYIHTWRPNSEKKNTIKLNLSKHYDKW